MTQVVPVMVMFPAITRHIEVYPAVHGLTEPWSDKITWSSSKCLYKFADSKLLTEQWYDNITWSPSKFFYFFGIFKNDLTRNDEIFRA